MKYQPRHRSGTSHPLPVRWAGVLTEYMHRAAIFKDTLENHINNQSKEIHDIISRDMRDQTGVVL
ncbi:hypothetical protein CR164_00965 [Prosthecochloris marina]|uniref:Uncharacterized protein n=1 Tax=Prosthecochloris marina TaxID=2017681 RepID=A0A317T8Z4_9CHLB|nr:hypothetical protein CR164_00965 [Prosthecochloris marina]